MATTVTDGHSSNGYHQGRGPSQSNKSIDTTAPQKVYERVLPTSNGYVLNGHQPKNGSAPQKPFSSATAKEEIFDEVSSFNKISPTLYPEFTSFIQGTKSTKEIERGRFWEETVPTIAGVAIFIIVCLGLLAVSVYAYYNKAPITLTLN